MIGAREMAAPLLPSTADRPKKGPRPPPSGPVGVIPVRPQETRAQPGESAMAITGPEPSSSTAHKMAETVYSTSTRGEQTEAENRLDKAFQAFWENLEALLSPTTPEKGPDTLPRTPTSLPKQKTTQKLLPLGCTEKWSWREITTRQGTKDTSGGNRSKKATPWCPTVPMLRRTSPLTHHPGAPRHRLKVRVAAVRSPCNRPHGKGILRQSRRHLRGRPTNQAPL
ncbi:Hypothetical predicted protein [Pelobates cultripes]|uniref:Uncharacterized protein n=1 Tax=Pelobates cultripes TaxID=61616 RepID=A0AAD1RH27_PELCU|nr:Hypothetical predicted protein [Pelobates cultripes]